MKWESRRPSDANDANKCIDERLCEQAPIKPLIMINGESGCVVNVANALKIKG